MVISDRTGCEVPKNHVTDNCSESRSAGSRPLAHIGLIAAPIAESSRFTSSVREMLIHKKRKTQERTSARGERGTPAAACNPETGRRGGTVRD